MRNRSPKLNNSGVALVTVLVITAVTLALGYAALTISLSVLQGSKAAESSVQARLNAESGLDAELVFISEFVKENEEVPNKATLSHVDIPAVISQSQRLLSNKDYVLSSVNESSLGFIIGVSGFHADDTKYFVTASVGFHGSGNSDVGPSSEIGHINELLSRGITSCSDASLGGSSVFKGGGTFFSGGDFTFASASPNINGTMIVAGTLTVSNDGTVTGDAYARNIILNNNIKIRDLYATDSIIISAYGAINSMNANNLVRVTIPYWYSGFPGKINTPELLIDVPGVEAFYRSFHVPKNPLVTIPNLNCAEFDITDDLRSFADSITPSRATLETRQFEKLFITRNGVYYDSPANTVGGLELVEATFLGRSVVVLKVDRLKKIAWHETIEIGSDLDVVIISTGAAQVENPNNIIVPPTSSLTILSYGQIGLYQGSTRSSTIQSVGNYNQSRLSLFSLSASNNAVTVNDYGEYSALIYAPRGTVSVTGSAALRGVVLGNHFTLNNANTTYEYDANYLNLEISQPIDQPKPTISIERR